MRKILFLMVLVLSSACVGREVRTEANSGLAINKFFADPDSADSGDLFRVHMEIENVGGRAARSVLLELISSAFEGQPVDMQPGIIRIGQPLPPVGTTRTERNYYFQSLAAPKPELNQAGDFRLVSWDLQAPFVPEGIVKEFRVLGKATYEYSTSAAASIPVYTKNEFRQSKSIRSFEVLNTNGPLKAEISGPRQIVVSTDSDIIAANSNEFAVYTITIRNTGDGIPITGGINGLVTGTMKFTGGITPVSCLEQPQEIIPSSPVLRGSQQTYESSTFVIELPQTENGLLLKDGQSAVFSCTLGLSREQWIFRPFGTATISFDLNYLYFIEKEATVRVKGIREYSVGSQ